MDFDSRLRLQTALLLSRRFAPEHLLDSGLVQCIKTALRRAALEINLDLALERVSLWRETGSGFEHLTSTRTIYQAFREADHYQEDIFILDATAGEVLTVLTRPPEESMPGEGK